MPLIAVDSNIVDFVEEACFSHDHVDAMDAMEPPPPFRQLPVEQEVEVFACYWLLAMAPRWTSMIYTFSDALYEELARAPRASCLFLTAHDVLVLEEQVPEAWNPASALRPDPSALVSLGLKPADAVHVADAIALGCRYFLTSDRQLRNRATILEERYGLRVRRASDFLVEAVREGAPWTTLAPWPWESIERIHASRARSPY